MDRTRAPMRLVNYDLHERDKLDELFHLIAQPTSHRKLWLPVAKLREKPIGQSGHRIFRKPGGYVDFWMAGM